MSAARPHASGSGVRQSRDRFDHTGIVDQDVQAPEGVPAARHGGRDIGVPADIARDRFGLAAGLADFRRELFNVAR